MARLRPAHVPGGIYYVVLRANRNSAIFVDEEDRAMFDRIVAQSLDNCRARVHAYCWTSSDARMAVQVADVPLGHLVQRITCQHARWVNRKRGQSGHLFQQGYRVTWLERQGHLRELVRHLHLVPVQLGLVEQCEEYLWSSHRAYLGLEKVPWLTTSLVLSMLPRRPRGQRVSYEEFISRGLVPLSSSSESLVLSRATPPPSSDSHFLSWLAQESSAHKEAYIRQILNAVSQRLHVPLVELLSNSHAHHVSLARALVTWHITHHRVATLTEVAKRFGRHPSTLCVAMKRYRRGRPELFGETIEELLGTASPEDEDTVPEENPEDDSDDPNESGDLGMLAAPDTPSAAIGSG